jgi:hypothetical protein
LKIPIPDESLQTEIIKLTENFNEQQRIANEILKVNRAIYDSLAFKLLNGVFK